MLVFVDESGDPGLLKIGCGGSKYFVVTLVIFEDKEEAEAADRRIELFKKKLSVPPKFEFHFHENKPETRKRFLRMVSRFSFFYFSIVINKTKLYGEGFKDKNFFYKYTSRLVFENAKPYLRNAKVVFDKSGSKTFRGELSRYLKEKINENHTDRLIKKVKMEKSHSNNLIQLADMVCGAVFRSYNLTKIDWREYRNIIKHREIYVQFWPK